MSSRAKIEVKRLHLTPEELRAAMLRAREDVKTLPPWRPCSTEKAPKVSHPKVSNSESGGTARKDAARRGIPPNAPYIESEREYLDWLRVRCGLPRIGNPGRSARSYDMLSVTEWSPRLERHMRNRLIVGALRYGLLHDKRKPAWDRISRAIAELQLFREDHNKERLVDAANMCLLEFEEGFGHFEASDDAGLHTGIMRD